MGTIAEKLTYLNDTRLKIKDGLNKFGADLTENDTFRSYSNVINDIYDKLPKVSGNGSNFSLENAQNGKLDLFEMEGNTHQDGSPSPSPDFPQQIKVVENEQIVNVHGKNLFDKDSANIIDNKYLNASGVEVNDNAFAISDYIQIQSNQTYSLTPRINVSACLCYYDTNKNFISSVSLSNINNTFVTPANSYYIKTSFKKDVANSIQIEQGSTATSFEPYHNKDYEINLHGKNFIEGSNDFSGVWNNSQKWETDTNSYNNLIVKKKQGTWNGINKEIYITAGTYTFSLFAKSDSARTAYIYLGGTLTTDNLVPQAKQLNLTTEWQRYDVTFTSNANGTVKPRLENPTEISDNYTYICGYQLEKGSTATDYEEFYDYELCKIRDYKDVIFKNNQLSEYYDSTLDEDSWYIKKEIGKVVLNGSESWIKNSTYLNAYYVDNYFTDIIQNADRVMISDYFTYGGKISSNASVQTGKFYTWTALLNRLVIGTDLFNSLADFKAWLSTHNVEVYYVLATPTYEIITNETLINQLEAIETHTGTNIFEVSNDNDVLPSLNVKRLKELEKLS